MDRDTRPSLPVVDIESVIARLEYHYVKGLTSSRSCSIYARQKRARILAAALAEPPGADKWAVFRTTELYRGYSQRIRM